MSKVTIARVKRLLSKTNPGLGNLSLAWGGAAKTLTAKVDGSKYTIRKVIVSADGFKTKAMTVYKDQDSVMVR